MDVVGEAQQRLLGPSGPTFLGELTHELSIGARAVYSKSGHSPEGMDQWFRCHNELMIMISEQLLVSLGARRMGYPMDRFIEDLRTKARIYCPGCEQRLLYAIERALQRPYESADAPSHRP